MVFPQLASDRISPLFSTLRDGTSVNFSLILTHDLLICLCFSTFWSITTNTYIHIHFTVVWGGFSRFPANTNQKMFIHADCTRFIYFLVKILYSNIWWCNFVLIFSVSTYFAVIDTSLESYAVSIRDSQIQDRWLQRLAVTLQCHVWSLKNLPVLRGNQVFKEVHWHFTFTLHIKASLI